MSGSISSNPTRNDLYNALVATEAEQLASVCVEHFSIPLISGLSLEGVSQADYERMGGKGRKPDPLTNAKKLEIYQKIDCFFRAELTNRIAALIKSIGDRWFQSMSDHEIQTKYAKLKNSTRTFPNWGRLKDLFKDHLCLFKEFKKEKISPLDPEIVHAQLCPLMEKFRDSGALYKCIELDRLLKPEKSPDQKYDVEDDDDLLFAASPKDQTVKIEDVSDDDIDEFDL